ncbi:MAG: hypothetical protein HYW22_00650 [Candidatus Aenigmarchaeota archaeon]|nr:hypothetical protein [Candidatus Aenigmarchaeota archaeon]
MDNDRKLTIIYFILGVLVALVSVYIDTMIEVGLALVLYGISYFVTRKFIEVKKTSVFLTTTAVTYFLVWLVAWILVYNLK